MPSLIDKARLTGVWVFTKQLAYVSAIITALEEQGSDHTAMLRFNGAAWGQYMIPTSSVAHCVIPENERTVLTLSPFGVVHVANPMGFGWETLDNSEEGPNALRQMRDIRPIKNHVYSVGMGRMVYRRSSGGAWIRFDEGLRGNRSEIPIAGFLAIDGCSEDFIYTVGFKGEIWHFNGSRWTQIESPTNIKIERVRVVSPDLAVACGAAGIILVGSRNQWTAIVQNITNATFWGLEYFQDRFYLSTEDGVYTLNGTHLARVDLGPIGPVTTSRLHAADGVLWSVGKNDILVFDGRTWNRRNIDSDQSSPLGDH